MEFTTENYFKLEKSATVNSGDWIWAVKWIGEHKLCLLLGHNQVVVCNTIDKVVEFSVQSEECCLLYSGIFVNGKNGDNAESTHCSVICGTIFNDILVWLPFNNRNVIHRLCGHQGVIFGVTYDYVISHTLCSVSDDRSCRIWRYRLPNQSQLLPGQAPTQDQWLQGYFEPLHVLYGHEARAWNSIFIEKQIATVAEDGMICLWDTESGRLCKKWKAQRSGIRSVDVDLLSKKLICGSDSGCIFSVQLPVELEVVVGPTLVANGVLNGGYGGSENITAVYCVCSQWSADSESGQSLQAKETAAFKSNSSARSGLSPAPLQLERSSIVTVTDCGNVLVSDTDGEVAVMVNDPSLRYSTGHRHGNRIALGNLDGCVYMLEFGQDLKPNIRHFQPFTSKIFSVHLVDNDRMVLVCGRNGVMFLYESATISKNCVPLHSCLLPAGKQRWLESANYFSFISQSGQRSDFLAVGDRNGGVYFYGFLMDGDSKDSLREPMQSFSKVHGNKEVTDFMIDHQHTNILHSIGRDGCWRKWRFEGTNSKNRKWRTFFCEKLSYHFEWPSQFIRRGHDLLIAGFKSDKFVLYNSETGHCLCEIECGGGHRRYDMQILDQSGCGAGVLKFLFVKKGCACQVLQPLDSIDDITPSLHLRRITDAIAVTPFDTDGIQSPLIATCSEDTTIAVWSINNRSLQIRQRLKGHISSVHCLCSSGNWLISGGGRSEVCWWQYVDGAVGYRLICRHKNTDDDVRCLGLQIYRSVENRGADYVVAIFSDGRLSIFLTQLVPREAVSRPIEVIRLRFVCCLTRVHLLPPTSSYRRTSDDRSVSGGQSISNDQSIYCNQPIRNCRSIPDDQVIPVDHSDQLDQSISDKHQQQDDLNRFPLIFAIGTDGKLYIVNKLDMTKFKPPVYFVSFALGENYNSDNDSENAGGKEPGLDDSDQLSVYTRSMKNRSRRRKILRMQDERKANGEKSLVEMDIHSYAWSILIEKAGLTALDLRWIDGVKDESLCCIGTESGAIHLLRLRLSTLNGTSAVEILSRLLFPDWHTSTVSGIAFNSQNYVVSNSIDQRVGVWEYEKHTETGRISLISDFFSHVADPANIRFIGENNRGHLIICGAGIQIMKVDGNG